MTNPNPQMLLIDPKDELKFYGPFDASNHPTAKLSVTNPTPYSIYYKIKTTASFRYYVTPRMGLLLPNSHEDIIIGMKAPRGNTQDKFKLVAMVSPSTGDSPAKIWENFDESQAMCTKLLVVFVDEQEPELTSVHQEDSQQKFSETIPSLAKIVTFIVVGFVAVISSLYRLGTK